MKKITKSILMVILLIFLILQLTSIIYLLTIDKPNKIYGLNNVDVTIPLCLDWLNKNKTIPFYYGDKEIPQDILENSCNKENLKLLGFDVCKDFGNAEKVVLSYPEKTYKFNGISIKENVLYDFCMI